MRLNIGCGIFWANGFTNIYIHDEREHEEWYDADNTGAPSMELDLRIRPWPFEDNSIECIIESHWLGVEPQRVSVCEEAYRVLKPGGWLRIADSPWRFWVPGLERLDEPHNKLMDRKDFVAALEKMGFEAHEIDPGTTLIPGDTELKATITNNHHFHKSFVLEFQKK